jgi:hypothetical protein
VVGTTSAVGGGADNCELENCIVYYNSAPGSDNYSMAINSKPIHYCCTTPLAPYGIGNITNEPGFVDCSNGNFLLISNSACVDSGGNPYMTNSTDLAGHLRISGGIVDMGAYEFQNFGLTRFQIWLQSYGFPIDGSADFTDPDHDGMNTWQEWRCGTVPTNSLSMLKVTSFIRNASGVTLTWQSVTNRNYFIQRSSNLTSPSGFKLIQGEIIGQPGSTSFTDTNGAMPGAFYYRVGVP